MNVIRIGILVLLGVYFTGCSKFGSGEDVTQTSLSKFSSDALVVQDGATAQAPPENRGNGKNPKNNQNEDEDENNGNNNNDFNCDSEKVEDITLNATKLYFRVADDIIITVIEDIGEISLADLTEGIEFTAPEEITSDMGVIELEATGHRLETSEGDSMELTAFNGSSARIKIVLKESKTFAQGQEYVLTTDIDLANDLKRTNKGCLLIPTLFEQ